MHNIYIYIIYMYTYIYIYTHIYIYIDIYYGKYGKDIWLYKNMDKCEKYRNLLKYLEAHWKLCKI